VAIVVAVEGAGHMMRRVRNREGAAMAAPRARNVEAGSRRGHHLPLARRARPGSASSIAARGSAGVHTLSRARPLFPSLSGVIVGWRFLWARGVVRREEALVQPGRSMMDSREGRLPTMMMTMTTTSVVRARSLASRGQHERALVTRGYRTLLGSSRGARVSLLLCGVSSLVRVSSCLLGHAAYGVVVVVTLSSRALCPRLPHSDVLQPRPARLLRR
jgi:hypothetical protein